MMGKEKWSLWLTHYEQCFVFFLLLSIVLILNLKGIWLIYRLPKENVNFAKYACLHGIVEETMGCKVYKIKYWLTRAIVSVWLASMGKLHPLILHNSHKRVVHISPECLLSVLLKYIKTFYFLRLNLSLIDINGDNKGKNVRGGW